MTTYFATEIEEDETGGAFSGHGTDPKTYYI
jgi:hypothetical protein